MAKFALNVNITACSVGDCKKLHEAGIGTYTLFQETYNKENCEALHPTGPKSDHAHHTEAMDRAMGGEADDVGIGGFEAAHEKRPFLR